LHKASSVQIAWKLTQLLIGGILGGVSMVVFLIPANVVPQGLAGLATVINVLVGVPIGVVIMLINIPILYIGYRMLPGGWRMIRLDGVCGNGIQPVGRPAAAGLAHRRLQR